MGFWEKVSDSRATAVILTVLILTSIAGLALVFQEGSLIGADQIQYTSNNEFFDGSVLVIQTLADKSTEELNVQFSEAELESETGEDFESGVSIEVAEQDSKSQYQIQDTGLEQVTTLETVQAEVYSDKNDPSNLEVSNWAQENCYDIRGFDQVNNKDYVVRSLGWSFSGYRYQVSCFTSKEVLGQVGDISADQVIFQANVEVQYGTKEPQTAIISNSDIGQGTTARVGEHVVITADGGLPTGKNSYATDDEYALYSSDDQWKVISESRHQRYVDYMRLDTNLYSKLEQWAQGDISESEAEQQINNLAHDAASEYQSSPLASGSFQGDFETGVLTVNYDKSLIWPALTYYINGGEYVTVEKPIGTPAITSVRSEDIREVGGGQVYATVENTASREGSFTTRITGCSSDFRPADTTETQQFSPGESQELSFWVSFESSSDNQKEVSGSCTVEARNSVGDTATQSVSVTGVQANKCEPNQRYRDIVNGNEVVRMCTSDGLPGEIIETCDGPNDSIESVNGQLQCVEHGSTGGGGTGGGGSSGCLFTLFDNPVGDDLELRNPFCGESLFGKIGATFHLVLTGVIAVVSARLGYRGARWVDGENRIQGSFKPFKSRDVSRIRRGRQIVGLLAGVIVFGIAAWIAYEFSIGLQLVGLVVLLVVDDRSRVKRAGGYAKRKAVETASRGVNNAR